ncbi:hypothetical protein L3V86_04430 [Thiotrichales bacterium 19S11-10]|nr:hypothetical protein [Thiotrichales bacterium 19S11-10]MCF6807239.1 hypothetical protein [Thiotrichales bacterium 19S9-11]MCF6811208.1 hypothetical protein [Thiotrichales bacterium 19S9-12]
MSKLQKNALVLFAVLMAFLNAYALYRNITYYIQSPNDLIGAGMVLFSVVEQTYCIYIFFLFKALNINLFDKLILYTLGVISIILNFYYLILDYQWDADFSLVAFWMSYNILMIVFSLTLFHFLYKYKSLI